MLEEKKNRERKKEKLSSIGHKAVTIELRNPGVRFVFQDNGIGRDNFNTRC